MVAHAVARNCLPDGGRFVALDSLRGIAALGVVAYHFVGTGPLFGSPILRSGHLWVDFFFVLSGFVIASAYGAQLIEGFPLRRYMVLRLGRIYPVHLAVLAAFLAMELAWWWFRPEGLSARAPFSESRSPERLAAAALLVQAFWPVLNAWNAPSWSISVEVWLYLGMALLWRFAGGRAFALALAASLAALAALAAGAGGATPILTGWVLRGIAGFGLGAACWRWLGPGGALRIPGGTAAEIACLAAICAVLASGSESDLLTPVASLAFAATVVVFAREKGAVSRLLGRTPCVFLGTVSYSLYMVHLLLMGRLVDLARIAGLGEVAKVSGKPLGGSLASPLVSDIAGLVVVAICIAAAWLLWRFVEAPAREWSRRKAAALGVDAEERAAPAM